MDQPCTAVYPILNTYIGERVFGGAHTCGLLSPKSVFYLMSLQSYLYTHYKHNCDIYFEVAWELQIKNIHSPIRKTCQSLGQALSLQQCVCVK